MFPHCYEYWGWWCPTVQWGLTSVYTRESGTHSWKFPCFRNFELLFIIHLVWRYVSFVIQRLYYLQWSRSVLGWARSQVSGKNKTTLVAQLPAPASFFMHRNDTFQRAANFCEKTGFYECIEGRFGALKRASNIHCNLYAEARSTSTVNLMER